MSRRNWTRREEEEAKRLRLSGLKLSAVARRLNRSRESVKRKLIRLGVIVDPQRAQWVKRRSGQLAAAVKRLLGRGESVTAAAELLGVCPSAVTQVRKRLQIPAATPRDRGLLGWQWRRAKGVA